MKIKFVITIITILLIVISVYKGCEKLLFYVSDVASYSSGSIGSSKEKKVFVSAYSPFILKINDTFNVKVRECFVEKQFGKADFHDTYYTIYDDKLQVVLILNPPDLDQYNIKWQLDSFYRVSNHQLVKYYNANVILDTLFFKNDTNYIDYPDGYIKTPSIYYITKAK